MQIEMELTAQQKATAQADLLNQRQIEVYYLPIFISPPKPSEP